MKRAAIALFLAVAAGVGCAELLYRWPAAREVIGRTFGRGELVAIVDGVGIYDRDGDVAQLIVDANLRRLSQDEQISADAIEREMELLRHQFGDPKVFELDLEASGLSSGTLRAKVADHVRGRQWIEKQIAPALLTSEDETRAFYDANQEQFAQPPRFRVSHLFLAAPAATPPQVIAAKGETIKTIAKRLGHGEDFTALVAEASEDEATKARGGDLGFFSALRMPAELAAEVQKLELGKATAPVRLPLGFHILQLTDTRPARQMEFAEVRDEILLQLRNAKRATSIERLREQLTAAEFLRTPL